MKTYPILIMSLALAAGFLTIQSGQTAILPWTDNGVTWSSTNGTPTYYNPDVDTNTNYFDKTPLGPDTAPIWSPWAITGSSTALVKSNYLEITTDQTSQNSYIINNGWDFEHLTFETRFRIESMSGQYYAMTIVLFANGKGLSLGFDTAKIMQFGTPLISGLDLTQWTVLRATVIGGGTPTVNLYINNNTNAAYSSSSIMYDSGQSGLLFGDASDPAEGGVTQWDYLRWTDAGAYAPIPEPSTLILIAFAGVIGMGWKRLRCAK